MPTIGEELKAARESKGLTLTEIAEKTRISHTFLKALEEDDYSTIPGEVFVTGFLRTYSKELGLNVADILEKYRELRPPKELQEPSAPVIQHHPKPSLISISRRRQQPERLARKKKNPLYLIIIGGLLLGAALTGITLFLTSRERPLEVQPPPPPAPVKKAPAPPVQKQITAFKSASSFKPNTAVPPPAKQPAQNTTPIVLKLTADGDSYYYYRKDQTTKSSGTLKKGKTLEIKADNEIILTLGNAGGVRAEFNGKKLGPFGKPAQVVKGIIFSREKQGVVPNN